MQHSRFADYRSESFPGVVYRVRRMSFNDRLELLKKLRAIAGELECRAAGDTIQDQVAAAVTEARIDQLYIEHGLEALEGLEVDGEPCQATEVLDRAPMELVREIVGRIRGESFLSRAERKN